LLLSTSQFTSQLLKSGKFELGNLILPLVTLTIARFKVMARTIDYWFC